MELLRSLVLILFAFIGLPVLMIPAYTIGFDLFTVAPDIAATCLYLAVANLGWTLGSPNLIRSVFAATAAIFLLAFGLPSMLNAAFGAEAQAEAATDQTAEAKLEAPSVVALLNPYETDRTGTKWSTESDCTLLCQRLLYGGNRVSVLMGATPSDGNPASAEELTRYSIQQRPTCPTIRVPAAGAMPGEHHVLGTYPTSDAVTQSIARGRCLVSSPGDISEAQVVGMWTAPSTKDFISARQAGGGVATHRVEMFTRSGPSWQRFARSTERLFASARSPFWLKGDGFTFRPLDDEERSSGDDPYIVERVLKPWLGKPY